MNILVLNCGSSSLKFQIIETDLDRIKSDTDVYELSQTEMAYCPMLAENYDVLNKAADFAVRKLEKRK